MVRVIVRKCFACPACDKGEHRFDHLSQGSSWGPWYCDDCGAAFRGTIDSGGMPVVVLMPETGKINTLVLLRLRRPLDDGSLIHIVVEGMRFLRERDPEMGHPDEYFYNEHTCPTNYLGVEVILDGDDTDPHGVFEWVATVDRPADFDDCNVDWFALFPALTDAGTVIDGELSPLMIAGAPR